MKEYFPRYLNEAYLMLTEFCPLRCEYCYIKERNNPFQMSMEVVDKTISLFNGRNVEIVFFGGEPLVAMDLLEEIFYKYKNQLRFQVVTSGLVNFDRFLAFYKKNHDQFKLQISWDGVVTARKMANGSIKQDEVYNNILTIGEEGLGAQIRCVINDTNITNWAKTYEVFRDLRMRYKLTGDFTVAHQPSFESDFAANIKIELNKILAIVKEDLEKDNKIYLPQMLTQYIFAIASKSNGGSCDVGNYIVIRPNGDIYPCTILSQSDDPSFNMGNVLKPKTIDTEIITSLKTKPDKCNECECSSICDGGCRYERHDNFDTNWKTEACGFTCDNAKVFTEVLAEWYKGLGSLQIKLNNIFRMQIGLTAAQYSGAPDESKCRQEVNEYWE